jgi:hypothetical protein
MLRANAVSTIRSRYGNAAGSAMAAARRCPACRPRKQSRRSRSSAAAAAKGGSESALLRSGSGVAGVADARIQAAYQALADAKASITPAKLATRAVTGYPTALRWLRIHHPELLVKPDDASVAPVAVAPVAPEPKSAPPETVLQKQPDAAPKKRVTAKAKAKLLPKKLRNPKTYPELLADAKPAQKPFRTPPKGKTPPKAAVRSSKGLFKQGQTCPHATFFMTPELPDSWHAFTKPPSRRAQPEEPVALDFEVRAQDFLKRITTLSADLAARGRTRTLALQKLHRICQAEVRRLKARSPTSSLC